MCESKMSIHQKGIAGAWVEMDCGTDLEDKRHFTAAGFCNKSGDDTDSREVESPHQRLPGRKREEHVKRPGPLYCPGMRCKFSGGVWGLGDVRALRRFVDGPYGWALRFGARSLKVEFH